MDELIEQIRAATQAGFYYLALMGALMLPDICGALASEDGVATPSKYRDWLAANVPEQAASAAAIYGLRCSLLHQGRAHPPGGHPQLVFFHPASRVQIHNSKATAGDDTVALMSISMFVDEMTRGA